MLENLVSHSIRILEVVFFSRIPCRFFMPFIEEKLLHWQEKLPERQLSPHRIFFLVTPPSKPLVPWLLSLAGSQHYKMIPFVPNVFCLRNMGVSGNLQCSRNVFVVFIRLVPQQSLHAVYLDWYCEKKLHFLLCYTGVDWWVEKNKLTVLAYAKACKNAS